eukprot:765299-Hanusia_phi.AAC.2
MRTGHFPHCAQERLQTPRHTPVAVQEDTEKRHSRSTNLAASGSTAGCCRREGHGMGRRASEPGDGGVAGGGVPARRDTPGCRILMKKKHHVER